ncbi:hypothetical protein ABID56_002603 [Alkalibacillus flavidus]|uniref:Transcriptional regulator, AbiEi antitoxin, Type IV TA system n=1 Tax=Alkalibacillus flavidus TaxID=546021 RepID=A0ABV2KY03_9BACI
MTLTYGYNEPIFTDELRPELALESSTLRMKLKRLADKNKIKRYAPGIYFIPKPDALLNKQTLSFNQVIQRKYLYENHKPIGYQTGIALANQFNLTSQTPGIFDVVTNKETSRKRKIKINNWQVILRKPIKPINEQNIKILQALDLLSNYDKLSEKSPSQGYPIILEHLAGMSLPKHEFESILSSYPETTLVKVHESGLYNHITKV